MLACRKIIKKKKRNRKKRKKSPSRRSGDFPRGLSRDRLFNTNHDEVGGERCKTRMHRFKSAECNLGFAEESFMSDP